LNLVLSVSAVRQPCAYLHRANASAEYEAIAPTSKAFKLTMSTVARWNAQGTMDEEYLFWDNQTCMQQIGLSK
jgi:hypothetical protein